MLDLTIVILADANSDLAPLLNSLATQTDIERLRWEVLAIWRADTEREAIAMGDREFMLPDSWPQGVRCRSLVGVRQGAAAERQSQIESAEGQLVGFLSPDMTAAPDWIRSAVDFMKAAPGVGAIGSHIEPRWEREPEFAIPDWLLPYIGVVRRGDRASRYTAESRRSPLLGGSVVIRNAWLRSVPRHLFLLSDSRTLGRHYADRESVLRIQRAGWEVWHNPRMRLERSVPSGEVEPQYLYDVAASIGRSRNHIRLLCLQRRRYRPFALVAYVVKDGLALLWHCIRYGRSRDVAVTCERERRKHSCASLLYLARYYRFRRKLR